MALFSRKSKEEKQREKLQREQEEARRLHQQHVDKAIANRRSIIEKNRDKLLPELEDKDILTFSYSKNEKVVIAVYPDRIRLRSFQRAIISTGLRGEKTIYLNRITSVHFKDPGITAGYIQFKVGGEGESKSSTMDAVHDENAVTFAQDQHVEFGRLRDIVEDQIQKIHSRGSAPPPTQSSKADELAKLAALRDQGILTDEEFQKEKSRVLRG